MSLKIKLGVLVGGKSNEHEVSLVSGFNVLSNLDKDKYDIYVIVIDKDGSWYLYSGDYAKLPDGQWKNDEKHLKKVVMTSEGILLVLGDEANSLKLDVMFPVLHGANGEDGKIQGLFAIAGLPFVGSDTTSSAVCMDKDITNSILSLRGIRVSPWLTFRANDKVPFEDIEEEVRRILCYPVFVKPANSGSSCGVSKVKVARRLKAAIDLAFTEDDKILIQQAVEGHEVECAVLGNDDLIVSIPGEVESCNEFYDYEAKYSKPSNLYIPARISKSSVDKFKKIAKKVFVLLGCRGLARVDGIVDMNGDVWLLEVNTFPGFTQISMYPKLMEEMGIGYSELLDSLIKLALEKKEEKSDV